MRRLFFFLVFFPLVSHAQQLDLSPYQLTPLTAENLEEGIRHHFEERALVRGLIAEHVAAGRLPQSEIENFAKVPTIDSLRVRDLRILPIQQTTARMVSFLKFRDVPLIFATSVIDVGREGKPVQTFTCGIDLLPGSQSASFRNCQSSTETLESFSVSFSDVKVEKTM